TKQPEKTMITGSSLCRKSPLASRYLAALIPMLVVSALAQPAPAAGGFDDHQNMMDQLSVKTLRHGPDPNNQSTFNEATANIYSNSMPDVLMMKNGTKVTRADQWPARRAEIQEDFEREVYGRIPANTPKVTWEVMATSEGTNGGIPTITKTLVGHVDNSGDTNITVNIQASFTVPANSKEHRPIMIEFGFGGFGAGFGGGGFGGPGRGGPRPEPSWHLQALTNGWAWGSIVPNSIQGDNNRLTSGIIG